MEIINKVFPVTEVISKLHGNFKYGHQTIISVAGQKKIVGAYL